MNLINRDTDYAVRALCYMAGRPDKVVSASELCPALHVPRAYLRLILQKLAHRGVLRSFRGKGGGFRLNRSPSQITLVDIIDIFQGKMDLASCILRNELCPNISTCHLRRTIKQIEKSALATLRSTTIASLASGR